MMTAPEHDGTGSRFAAPHRKERWKTIRTVAFPLLTNAWPLLLFVSQKAFVLPGIVLVGLGDQKYRRDMMLAIALSVVGLLVYLTQFKNGYDQLHLIGYLLFVFAMPMLNYGVRYDAQLLRRLLTYVTLFNVVLSLYFLVYDIDLYGFRGLNRIEGSDGVTYRIYFESSSLAAIFLLGTFRNRWLQLATLGAVALFVVFIARSAVVMALLAMNLIAPYILRSPPHIKAMASVLAFVSAVLLFIYLPIIRPDIGLSLSAKQLQFQVIISLIPENWVGWGWGGYIPYLSTDRDQPYQIEMQLPMLVLQLGPVAISTILLLILAMFLSAADRSIRGYARFTIYALIGFNNPWLFLPSWYLTCQLLFRVEDEPVGAPPP